MTFVPERARLHLISTNAFVRPAAPAAGITKVFVGSSGQQVSLTTNGQGWSAGASNKDLRISGLHSPARGNTELPRHSSAHSSLRPQSHHVGL